MTSLIVSTLGKRKPQMKESLFFFSLFIYFINGPFNPNSTFPCSSNSLPFSLPRRVERWRRRGPVGVRGKRGGIWGRVCRGWRGRRGKREEEREERGEGETGRRGGRRGDGKTSWSRGPSGDGGGVPGWQARARGGLEWRGRGERLGNSAPATVYRCYPLLRSMGRLYTRVKLLLL